MNAIDNALAAAETAAASAAPAQLPATTVTGTAVASPVVGRRITTDDRIGSSMAVDHFIKFNAGGMIQVGQSATDMVKSISVFLNLSEVQAGFGINYEDVDGKLHYIRTTDGVTTDAGGNWDEEVARGRRVKPSLKPYNSWQIPFVLKDASAGPAKAGDRLGYTTVWSSFQDFGPLFDNAVKQFGKDAMVEIKIEGTVAANSNNKTYGRPKFTLVGIVAQED